MQWPNVFSSGIINQSTVQKLISLYARSDNWHNLDYKTSNLGYGYIHYSMIRNLQPDRVLCIGSKYGFIPAICALACRDNQKGIVDFVDPGYDFHSSDPHHAGGVGLWKKIDPHKYFRPFGLNQYLTLHLTTSKQYSVDHKHYHFQYIHIDGDHTTKGVKTDFDLFWPKLESPGFMAFHDIYTQGYPDVQVSKFWQKLKDLYPAIEFPGDSGLGLIQKVN